MFQQIRNTIFEEDSWQVRRVVVFGILIYCGCAVAFILWRGEDNALNRDVATNLILLVGAIGNGYIFGAIWDSNNRRKRRTDMQPGVRETTTIVEKTAQTTDPVAPIAPEGS